MKNKFKYLGMATFTVLTFAACSPESFSSPDENGIPLAENYADSVHVTVDQSLNKVYLACHDAPGIRHFWIIDGKKYTTDTYDTLTYKTAGDYYVEAKFMNDNGISNGTIKKTFHIDKDAGFNGFVYDSDYNLWKKATITGPTFWYAPGWAQIADPAYQTIDKGYSVSLPTATTDQWQAQMKFATNISTSSSKSYDFSIILTSSKNHPGVTVKLDDVKSDKSYYFQEKVALKAGESTCFYKSDMKGIDINNVELVLDFGGNEAGTDISIEKVVLKDHANDDGTVVPEPVDNTDWADLNSDDNLWKSVNGGAYTTYFYYAPGWSQITDPVLTDDKKGNYTLTLPTATSAQWQAQYHQISTLALSASETYDFQCTLTSSTDVKGVTVKPSDTQDDNNYLFVKNVDLVAGEKKVVKMSNVKCAKADMVASKLVFDFGQNPDNTVVQISNIILQKHKEKQ